MIHPLWAKPSYVRIKEFHHQSGQTRDWNTSNPHPNLDQSSPAKCDGMKPAKLTGRSQATNCTNLDHGGYLCPMVTICHNYDVTARKRLPFHCFSQIGEAQALRIHLWSSKLWSHCQSPSGDFPTDDIEVQCGANRVEQLETAHWIFAISWSVVLCSTYRKANVH